MSQDDQKVPLQEQELHRLWVEAEDKKDHDERVYDPIRGDHVDHLNDTAPAPVPAGPPIRQHPKRRGKNILLIIFIVLLVLAAGAYLVLIKHSKSTGSKTATTSSSQVKQISSLPQTIVTKHYDSPTYSVGLDYPETWKVADTDTKLTITSPQSLLMNSAGKQVNVYVQVSLENKQTALPEFAKGSATAILESTKLKYKKPTPNQRAQTYITFASYTTTIDKGWDAIYVTGDNGYTLGQYVPMSDLIQTDPFIQVRFLQCTDQSCSGTPIALSLNSNDWKDTALAAPIQAVLQSFSFD